MAAPWTGAGAANGLTYGIARPSFQRQPVATSITTTFVQSAGRVAGEPAQPAIHPDATQGDPGHGTRASRGGNSSDRGRYPAPDRPGLRLPEPERVGGGVRGAGADHALPDQLRARTVRRATADACPDARRISPLEGARRPPLRRIQPLRLRPRIRLLDPRQRLSLHALLARRREPRLGRRRIRRR